MKMEQNKTPKNADFACKLCDFECFKLCDWLRHVKTIKHTHRHDGNKMENAENIKNAAHNCKCGKIFQSYSCVL